MKITKEFLKSLNPCEDGYQYWLECGLTDLAEFMQQCPKDGHPSWAYWLFTRSVEKPLVVKTAIFSAELVLPIFERKYPNDNRPRKAIDAAKEWVLAQSVESEKAAYVAARAAARAAYVAARSASHAAAYAARDANKKIIAYCIELIKKNSSELALNSRNQEGLQ